MHKPRPSPAQAEPSACHARRSYAQRMPAALCPCQAHSVYATLAYRFASSYAIPAYFSPNPPLYATLAYRSANSYAIPAYSSPDHSIYATLAYKSANSYAIPAYFSPDHSIYATLAYRSANSYANLAYSLPTPPLYATLAYRSASSYANPAYSLPTPPLDFHTCQAKYSNKIRIRRIAQRKRHQDFSRGIDIDHNQSSRQRLTSPAVQASQDANI